MTDREKMELQGLVRTVRSEIMEFDKEKGQWKQPFYSWEIAFNKDGSKSEMIDYNPDGSVSKTLYGYDGSGLLLRTRFQMDEGPFGETLYQYDELGRFLVVCALASDLYWTTYFAGVTLAKDSRLAQEAARYNVNAERILREVTEGLARKSPNQEKDSKSQVPAKPKRKG